MDPRCVRRPTRRLQESFDNAAEVAIQIRAAAASKVPFTQPTLAMAGFKSKKKKKAGNGRGGIAKKRGSKASGKSAVVETSNNTPRTMEQNVDLFLAAQPMSIETEVEPLTLANKCATTRRRMPKPRDRFIGPALPPSRRRPTIVGAWTREENAALEKGWQAWERMDPADKPKDPPWKWIAQHVTSRTARQCRERWNMHMSSGIDRITKFTLAEDGIIISQWLQHGNAWAHISRLMGNRTDNQVKNRWNSCLSKLVSLIKKGSTFDPRDAGRLHAEYNALSEEDQRTVALPKSISSMISEQRRTQGKSRTGSRRKNSTVAKARVEENLKAFCEDVVDQVGDDDDDGVELLQTPLPPPEEPLGKGLSLTSINSEDVGDMLDSMDAELNTTNAPVGNPPLPHFELWKDPLLCDEALYEPGEGLLKLRDPEYRRAYFSKHRAVLIAASGQCYQPQPINNLDGINKLLRRGTRYKTLYRIIG